MPIDVEITTEGTRVLGGPIGSIDYCRSFAESVVQEVIEDLDVVSRMSSLQAQHCLTVGSVQHRVNHLWRMTPGGENSIFGDLMRKYDEALLSIPRRMTGRALLPDHALGLTGLSPASGGLGYRFWRSNADCAFLASYMHTSYHFPKLLPALAISSPPSSS